MAAIEKLCTKISSKFDTEVLLHELKTMAKEKHHRSLDFHDAWRNDRRLHLVPLYTILLLESLLPIRTCIHNISGTFSSSAHHFQHDG